MRVLLSIPCMNRGGTEMQTLYLAKALREAGHTVGIVCCFEIDRAVVDEFAGAGCRVEQLGLQRNIPAFRFISVMKSFYQAEDPDVLHIQYMTPGALSILAAKLAGVSRIFATVHQPYTLGHGHKALLFLKASAHFCEHFMAVSKVVEASWFGNISDCPPNHPHGRPRMKHCTLYNTVDTEKVAQLSARQDTAGFRLAYGLHNAFVFGYVGRLSHEKGVDILLEAFGALSRKTAEAGLLVVGDGTERATIEERFGSEIWWNRVAFAGSQTWESAMRHLSVMDAVVVPSRFEGFGLSAVEAMAASKAVVASDTGGLSEIIEHGVNGLLFANGDVDELAGVMESLIRDRDLTSSLARNARLRAMDFDVRVFNGIVQNLYQHH
ncbi:MAG: glycosyltransferase family 4 protein [Chlorobiaceae bacterium]|nr:glycosyltransferase family 4 protein [Chlorobiaceae bacterium]